MTTKKTATYDPKCHELAAAFLSDEPLIGSDDDIHELATHIQSEIESWIEFEREWRTKKEANK